MIIPRESAKLHGMTNNHQNDSDPLRNIDPVNTLCLSKAYSVSLPSRKLFCSIKYTAAEIGHLPPCILPPDVLISNVS